MNDIQIQRVILIVLDSLGVGAMPDAAKFGDAGADTLGHIRAARGGLALPHLCALGLGRIAAAGCSPTSIVGCYGKMAEQSANKDTTTGHWELAGIVTADPFPTYPHGFPPEIITALEEQIGTPTLGNIAASGTEIIKKLGGEHLKSGRPIVYTSADSVLQIAAHEDVVPLEKLYEYCRIARRILTGEHRVGRVIARPFRGPEGRFERNNAGRKDFSIQPPDNTLLDILVENGLFTVGVGKIGDIYGGRGVQKNVHTAGNDDGVTRTLELMATYAGQRGLIFANLVDFDMVYGHRRNPVGYAEALEAFDRRLPAIMDALGDGDLLMITADHGCDPTFAAHTDHTREYVPLLAFGPALRRNVDLGTRTTFADCGQTIADLLGVPPLAHGTSFKREISHA